MAWVGCELYGMEVETLLRCFFIANYFMLTIFYKTCRGYHPYKISLSSLTFQGLLDRHSTF